MSRTESALPAHFGDTTSIIGNRAKGIHGENIGAAHQHSHRRDGGSENATHIGSTRRNGSERKMDLAAKEK